MSKGEGKKIVIKFTQDLVSDVSGNESAMTITGQEFQHVDGPLLDKEYYTAKIERYPTLREWEIGEQLLLPFVEDFSGGYTENLIPLMTSNTSNGVADSSTYDGTSYYAYKAMDKNDGTYWSTTSLGKVPSWISYEFIESKKITKISMKARSDGGNGSPRVFTIEGLDENNAWIVLKTILNSSSWGNGEYREFEFANNNSYKKYRINITQNDGRGWTQTAELGMYESILVYKLTHTENIAVNLSGEYRIGFIKDTPSNTNIKILINSIEVVSGDSISIDNSTIIEATLSTTDNSVTPTLLSLWLEELNAPQDIIVLTVEPFNNFNNVEGNLTVEYDATQGNLSGTGGAVESFIEVFTPTELVQTPNPNAEEYVSVAPFEIIADLLDIEYPKAYGDMGTITVAPFEVTATLIDVEDINP